MPKGDLIFKRIERKRVSFIPKIKTATTKALWKQAQPVFENLSKSLSLESVLQNVNGIVHEDTIKVLYQSIYASVGVSFARDSFNLAKTGKFNYSTKADILDMTWELEMQKLIETEAAQLVTAVTQTTKDILSRSLQQSITDGLSIPQAAKALRENFGLLTRYRSELIARTEIVRASNAGSLAGAESTGLGVEKVWLSARDKRTRPDHIDADGQRKKLNEYFMLSDGSRLRYPGDPSAPGHQTIQCRCTQIYLQPGQQSLF